MKHITLASDLHLPLDAVTQTFAMLGKRGSGKTNTSGVMTEQMIAAGLPVVAIDPIGVWWGLRHGADGKSPGLPVVILGGEHADVPIDESSGVVIADFVIEHRTPVVIDLGLFSKNAQRRFMVDFAERLYVKNRDAMHVVLDECDTYVPQRIDHGGERLVGAINDIVRKGRARGLGVTLISQRPALVNKDVLTQIECLIAHRMTGPHDRDAIERWVEYNADKDQAKTVLASLQVLEIGEAWVWSPGWLGIFKRTRINLRTTFDSSATPKAGARVRTPKNAAVVDLESLKTKLASTIERAKEDDPRELRRQIAELKKQVAERPVEERTQEIPVVPARLRKAVEALEEHVRGVRDQVGDVMAKAVELNGAFDTYMMMASQVAAAVGAADEDAANLSKTVAKSIRISTATMPVMPVQAPKRRIDATGLHVGSNPKLSGGERRIMSVLSQHGSMDRNRLAVLAGYAAKGGGFLNLLSALHSKEYVEKDLGDVEKLTPDGAHAVGFTDMLPAPGDALFQFWLNHPKLGKAHRSILVALRKYNRAMTREQLGEATEYASDGGGFLNAVSRLRTLGLIEGKSEIRLVKDLCR